MRLENITVALLWLAIFLLAISARFKVFQFLLPVVVCFSVIALAYITWPMLFPQKPESKVDSSETPSIQKDDSNEK